MPTDILRELEEAAQPLIKLLKAKYGFHHLVTISDSRINLWSEELGIPYNFLEVKTDGPKN